MFISGLCLNSLEKKLLSFQEYYFAISTLISPIVRLTVVMYANGCVLFIIVADKCFNRTNKLIICMYFFFKFCWLRLVSKKWKG